jgi:Ca2+/H+ antiporter
MVQATAVDVALTALPRERERLLLWLLAFVPVLFAAHKLKPESVAAKTGDAVGGLLNATLGNLTELVIALTALRAGQYMLVKASIAGAIVTNTLFMLGASFLLGGLKYHVQEYNRVSARVQAGLLFLASVALLIPSAVGAADSDTASAFTQKLSAGLAVLLIVAYALGMLFSLKTPRAFSTYGPAFGMLSNARTRPNMSNASRFLPECQRSYACAYTSARPVVGQCPKNPRSISVIIVRTPFPENTFNFPPVLSRISATRCRGSPASSLMTRIVAISLNMRTTKSTLMSPVLWTMSGRSVALPIAW